MKNKGKILGKGIDALFQDLASLEEVDVKKESVIEISLNELRPNPYQPRKTFDENSLKELASSIAHSGVFQPIIVRESAVKGYEIIAGERRFRASKLAQKETISPTGVILICAVSEVLYPLHLFIYVIAYSL